MPLIKSISGIRGTLGETPGENLTSRDVFNFTSGFAKLLQEKAWGTKVVIGRDARPSGLEFQKIATEALGALGFTVIDLGLATTPSVELAVIEYQAAGGIIISASHNPLEWNALKFLNHQGEFLSSQDGARMLELAGEHSQPDGQRKTDVVTVDYSQKHIDQVLALPLVRQELIESADFKIVIDGINSVGGVVIPQLLRALGVKRGVEINCQPDGKFAHNPEPLEANLVQLKERVKTEQADLGIVVDPDVDRLAFVDERGEVFGEEYTLVAVADYVLQNYIPGKYQKVAVSNLSSSRALQDIARRHDSAYFAAAVGELNVVEKMKETNAIIGGEGNGGIIYPQLHLGRDALVGVALFLSQLALSGRPASEIRADLPNYYMVKDKLAFDDSISLADILGEIKELYKAEQISDIDGVKIDWPEAWVHLRASNTEPILRIYAEAKTETAASAKVAEIKEIILANINKKH